MTIQTPNDGTTKAELLSTPELARSSWVDAPGAALRRAREKMERHTPGSDRWWVCYYDLRKLEEAIAADRSRASTAAHEQPRE